MYVTLDKKTGFIVCFAKRSMRTYVVFKGPINVVVCVK